MLQKVYSQYNIWNSWNIIQDHINSILHFAIALRFVLEYE